MTLGAETSHSDTGTWTVLQFINCRESRRDLGAWYMATNVVGTKYSTQFTFTIVNERTGADVKLDYSPNIKSQAPSGGQLQINIDNFPKVKEEGLIGHEFAHGVLGVPDTYTNMTKYTNYWHPSEATTCFLRGVARYGQENNLMSTLKGTIDGKDLKNITLKIESELTSPKGGC